MIISLKWLADYVQIPASAEPLVEKLLMSGLNHEATERVGDDTAIDLEVTSNRPDCLGHIGVAREAALLFARPLHVPDPRPLEGAGRAAASVAVAIEAAELCPCYTARVIRGVRVGPSPQWLVERLATVGVASVNNVVDVTNYVMFECGQPLHAFDLGKLRGARIVVRRAAAGEPFTAINHKTYELDERMCVIADAEGPVALAGVMGGADTEISGKTADILLESAQFAPLAVRSAARGLSLASPSSYRFERTPDPAAVDWASRRAAALILETAGGTLEQGVSAAGTLAGQEATIDLRAGRVAEVLGIDVPAERQHAILTGLGFVDVGGAAGGDSTRWRAPSWRRDVSREIDLVEEIGRIEGYDRVPEDRPITARPVELSPRESTVRTASGVLVGAGFCEALTRSVVSERLEATAGPWGGGQTLVVEPALVRGADRLRRTLLPSLLEARAGNIAAGAPHGELFEVARAYVARPPAAGGPESPVEEPLLLGFVTGGGFYATKGLVEALLARLAVSVAGGALACRPLTLDLFTAGRAAEIVLTRAGGPPERIAVIGEFSPAVLDIVGLAGPATGAEVRLDRLEFTAAASRMLRRPSDYPAVERDVNLVVAGDVPWADVAAAIEAAAGPVLEQCRVVQVWQDAERLGAGKKSILVALRLRSDKGTLSGDEAGRVVQAVIEACGRAVGATLRA